GKPEKKRHRYINYCNYKHFSDRETNSESEETAAKVAKAAKVSALAEVGESTGSETFLSLSEKKQSFRDCCLCAQTITNGPSEWLAALHELHPSKSPAGINARRWRELLCDSRRLANDWGRQAHDLGWTARELFGVHPEALDARVDMQGLAWGG